MCAQCCTCHLQRNDTTQSEEVRHLRKTLEALLVQLQATRNAEVTVDHTSQSSVVLCPLPLLNLACDLLATLMLCCLA